MLSLFCKVAVSMEEHMSQRKCFMRFSQARGALVANTIVSQYFYLISVIVRCPLCEGPPGSEGQNAPTCVHWCCWGHHNTMWAWRLYVCVCESAGFWLVAFWSPPYHCNPNRGVGRSGKINWRPDSAGSCLHFGCPLPLSLSKLITLRCLVSAAGCFSQCYF